MKLYTKKMTYSLLAIGLLACAPGALAVLPLALGAARGAEFANCKRMCRGYFVDDANKKKLTGAIKKGDIKVDLKGVGKKRTCHCEYKGDLGIDKKQEFKQIEARKSKTQKNLKKVSKHADSKKCDQSKEMCLVKK